ncbi:similar to mKIAA0319 protein (predicted), isoform CRA_a [Rattus norvegicus]|uniref:Similar to mKIAA0319 protein (Predicted), isoform CRA_a n=1 Tax=Rattus norvegicus TaxID=10116 RepID=A6KLE9_RAT|nr:similar to mKIAA0319 protein (predicted), isoform CRA_a [Rattus norvegicus]
MVSPPGVLSSLLLLAAMAGGSSQQCSEGRTYSDAIISPNLESIRIMRVSHTFSVGDCTAACCDLPSCDLAWWFEGSCYLVNCMRPENCEPRTTGPIRSYLTFVRRPVQRSGQLLDYGDMMLGRGSPSGAWGDSLEDLRKDLPFLGKDGGPEETAEYSDDYKELERGLLQPSNQQDPRGSAEYPDWSLLPSSDGDFNASATGDNSAASTEKLQDLTPYPLDQEQLQSLNESTWSPTPRHSEMSSMWPSSVTASPTEEGLEGEETLQLQEQPNNSSGKKVVKALAVSAGDNLVLTLPNGEAELKASVEPAPPADTAYTYEWSLMSHPVDFQGKIKQENKPTLHLSQLSVGLYAFRVAVSGENAFGEGYVNVTVMPAARINQPPVAIVSPQIQELSLPLTSALIDGSQSTDDAEIVSYHWEEVDGPFLGEAFLDDSPLLRLSNLDPGNYTFRQFPSSPLLGMVSLTRLRLTITDSDGATNSTTAALIIRGSLDYPPVANAGPNQTITLPQNTIILNGNQSSDDHQIVLYEWFPDPGGSTDPIPPLV